MLFNSVKGIERVGAVLSEARGGSSRSSGLVFSSTLSDSVELSTRLGGLPNDSASSSCTLVGLVGVMGGVPGGVWGHKSCDDEVMGGVWGPTI